jgi:cellulose synthase/poly-beta-1,6-N-acetylglucosamine synthase-like glycosyltransferase/peptidoglycan/xylan/chitin deacetylase (PgdA/CDA1 family)/spore germination protein YaaH
MAEFDADRFIFLDTKGKRWPRLRIFILTTGILLFISLIFFFQSLFVTSQLQLPTAIRQMKARLKVLEEQDARTLPRQATPLWMEFSKKGKIGSDPATALRKDHAVREIRLGFYVDWDPGSYETLRAHADSLTHVCPEWLTMIDGEGNFEAKPDSKAAALAKEKHLVLMPLLSNLTSDNPIPEAVEGVINGPESRKSHFIAAILSHLKKAGAGGVVIDWADIDVAYRDAMTNFLLTMAEALHREHLELWLCVPAGRELNVFDLEKLSERLDRFIAVLHDQNSEKDPPGPIAGRDWFEGWLQTMTAYGEPSQWVVAIGSYGYDWATGSEVGELLDFDDVMTRAGRAGLQATDIKTFSQNPNFVYLDAGVTHTVWFLDAATALNQMRRSMDFQVGGFALSRLGTEDPGIWKVLAMKDILHLEPGDLAALGSMHTAGITSHVGKGEFLTVDPTFSDGERQLQLDESGQVTETYIKFPSYKTVYHQGDGLADQVSISFDDGPDPQWTPKILDILKEAEVKASFFLVGTNIESHPEIVRRILAEGHDIGIHTYSHPNLALVSPERAFLECNATERLIETITGRSTLLFRPPYNSDSRPHTNAELAAVQIAQDLGYLTVTDTIDPEDWLAPGADVILQRIKDSRTAGNIILLHDAGGNREDTVKALPQIIEYLHARGDHIVSLSTLIGETAEFLMPPVKTEHPSVSQLISSGGFRILHIIEELLWAFMMVATALTFLRAAFIAVIAFMHRRREADSLDFSFQPPISIIIAAYNEEKVIQRTLASLLKTDYRGSMEILVIDDGSTDATARIIGAEAEKDQRIRCIGQSNQGKARALQTGFAAGRHEIVVTLDADTRFAPDTLRHLVQPLHSDQVGAVSGHVRVGNLRTFISRCQSLEYTCGFNLDRRAYDLLNCITVVPGAISALRKSAVLLAGGISTDTLAEDTDLTLSLHRKGLQIRYAPRAMAWTEAPESYRDLARQRFRWAFGTLQCLWKHRDLIFKPGQRFLGWFSLPGTWFFQILLVAIAPVVDLLLIISIFFGVGSEIFPYFIMFLLIDVFLAIAACIVENEPLLQAWRILPMRFLYRPLLSWVVWKSIFKAVKGIWVSWDKLKRTASVSEH